MSNSAKHLIRSTLGAAVAAGLSTVLLLASAGQAAGGTTQTLRIFDRPVSLTLHRPDGSVVTHPPYPQTKPGDVLDVVSLAYSGNHAKHAKRASASAHLRCTFAASGPPDCVTHMAFGSSMLVFQGNPGTVILGTGRYLGATGRVISSKEVGNNTSDIVARITLR